MAGKQARILTDHQINAALGYFQTMRHPERNRVMLLLSAKAGLRAGEISQITWDMVINSSGEISSSIALENRIAKKGHGRIIPMHSDLREALQNLKEVSIDTRGESEIIVSERGTGMKPPVIYEWFRRVYKNLGLKGCSSHSGRRTMITKAARKASTVGASLRDVQLIVGHKDLKTTQTYVEAETDAQKKLMELI